MSKNLTKKQLKTLKNALGKQGLTLEDHENAEKSENRCEILQIDCFSVNSEEKADDNDGWYVGYGVEYNGVGISEAAAESSASDEEEPENLENRVNGESSGFDSDPPSDVDQPPVLLPNYDSRRESDDISDRGQLLYGISEGNGQEEPIFYVDKSFSPRNVNFLDGNGEKTEFRTGNIVVTNRFEVPKSREPDEEPLEGYQMIGGGPICTTSEGESDFDDFRSKSPEYPENSTSSAGLWCNFVVSVPGLMGGKFEIPVEKSKSIPLDEEKLAQISAVMANFKLPTPPGWEGVSDEKLLDFVRKRV